MTITFMCTTQCSWTPTIETLIHKSQQGRVVLQTSNAFRIPPNHPQFLSESLIKQILQGVSQSQESGILQELFLSDSEALPVFSQAQIDFLVPHLVVAFSQVTPEELIVFQSTRDKDGETRRRGTIAIFAPTTFFLTLQNSANYSGKPSKISPSSLNLQRQTTLLYSKEQAILPRKKAKRLMKVSSKDSWLAINYTALAPSGESLQVEENPPTTPTLGNQTQENQPNMNTLQEQLQDLQKTVDEQAEEIRQLQPTSPK